MALRAMAAVGYAAFQFGPNPADVAYLVLDAEAKYKQHDVLFIYVPGHPNYKDPVRMKAQDVKDGLAFRAFELKSQFADTTITYKVQLTSTTHWEKHEINLDLIVACRAEDTNSRRYGRFTLHGSLAPIMNALVNIKVVPLVRTPALRVTWDHRSTPPRLKCRIMMEKLAFVPGAGFPSRADVVLSVAGKRLQERGRLALEPIGARDEFVYEPRRPLKSATPYEGKVSVPLTPFFDALTGSATTVLR